MASIHKELIIEVDTERVWSILRDVAYVDRLFAGVLTGAYLDGDVRTVTFANGLVVRERIIGIDDARRRVVYAVHDEPFQHHSASMQVLPEGAGRCRFIWISDFLPNGLVEMVSPLIGEGARVMKHNLESGLTAPP
jgi:Polyketide cyclase / dehydrase and lipid transport